MMDCSWQHRLQLPGWAAVGSISCSWQDRLQLAGWVAVGSTSPFISSGCLIYTHKVHIEALYHYCLRGKLTEDSIKAFPETNSGLHEEHNSICQSKQESDSIVELDLHSFVSKDTLRLHAFVWFFHPVQHTAIM
uniref:Uncharacterized protein n=1 Tax=Cacopsylla melanoneura TaxID=428564 RepID=A0A8D8X5I8_9HEMI